MTWLTKIFSKKKTTNSNYKNSVLDKNNLSIKECETNILENNEEIENIKKWIIEAIHEVFEVHNDFWYEEIDKYENIKKHKVNSKISKKVIKKCDKIISDYHAQIKIRKAKLNLYNILLNKFKETRERLLSIQEKNKREQKTNTKLEKLEKHSKRIENMIQKTEEIEKHYTEKENLKNIEEEVENIIEEFEINEEVKLHMQKINSVFLSNSDKLSTINAIEEINRLTDKLNVDE